MGKVSCCTPSRTSTNPKANSDISEIGRDHHVRNSVFVSGGRSLLGTARPVILGDCEGPPILRRTRDLWWERGAISVGQFKAFAQATGYTTLAEREGWSFVFHTHVPGGSEGTLGVEGLEWWRKIDGANWNQPLGPLGLKSEEDLPVVHIAHEDAKIFAKWAGGRLPHETEWEHAARGGLGDVRYPWGDKEPNDSDFFPCNIWQGQFPKSDTGADGYSGPAPVISFQANGFGLYNMVGNVWEWSADPFRLRSNSKAAKQINAQAANQRLLKGGSFLCHESYCHRYRIAARTGNTRDSTSSHTGFRVVYDTQLSQS